MYLWCEAAKYGSSFGVNLAADGELAQVDSAVDFIVASDTIMFWAPMEKADYLVAAVARVFLRALGWGAPTRGAVAVGDCILDLKRHILIGYPIVQALEAEKRQNWLGVAVLPDAAANLTGVDCIVPYDVPLKDPLSTPPLRHALAWHWAEDVPGAAEIYLERLSDVASDSDRAKYDNTGMFVRSKRREKNTR